jgi:uncharacterized protein (DUF2147 family)
MKSIVTSLLLAFLLLFFVTPCSGAQPLQADDIVGNWMTFREGKHHGTIAICRTGENTFEGRIVWGEHPDRLDSKNPDPALRSRRLVGQIILRDFSYKGGNNWAGGRIYDPDNGSEYKSYMKLDDDGRDKNTLRLRGYIGIPLIGRTEKWTRSDADAGK